MTTNLLDGLCATGENVLEAACRTFELVLAVLGKLRQQEGTGVAKLTVRFTYKYSAFSG